jgi:2-vinyl bacteriochlorophyllide hydratase
LPKTFEDGGFDARTTRGHGENRAALHPRTARPPGCDALDLGAGCAGAGAVPRVPDFTGAGPAVSGDGGEGYVAATVSILVKTGLLYTIMVTGAIWEKVVFGQYLFAPAFFWEDVFSFAVIALHTAYVWVLLSGGYGPQVEMVIALAAYLAYVINAAQFLIKLRMARLESEVPA